MGANFWRIKKQMGPEGRWTPIAREDRATPRRHFRLRRYPPLRGAIIQALQDEDASPLRTPHNAPRGRASPGQQHYAPPRQIKFPPMKSVHPHKTRWHTIHHHSVQPNTATIIPIIITIIVGWKWFLFIRKRRVNRQQQEITAVPTEEFEMEPLHSQPIRNQQTPLAVPRSTS